MPHPGSSGHLANRSSAGHITRHASEPFEPARGFLSGEAPRRKIFPKVRPWGLQAILLLVDEPRDSYEETSAVGGE